MADLKSILSLLNTDGCEGPSVSVGYVPCQPGNFYGKPSQSPDRYTAIGASGVTIGTGCDLGQTDIGRLISAGVRPDTVQKLVPYIGLKKDAAIRALAAQPLSLTDSEVQTLDSGHIKQYLDRFVRPEYEKASGASFDALPPQAQAVIFSVCYQKGCTGVRRDWPKLWKFLTNQQWPAAANELKTGFPQYKLRRRIEGELLSTV